jgi:hypothetical protein
MVGELAILSRPWAEEDGFASLGAADVAVS